MVEFEDLDEIEEKKNKTPKQKVYDFFLVIYKDDFLTRLKDDENQKIKENLKKEKEKYLEEKKITDADNIDGEGTTIEENESFQIQVLIPIMRKFYIDLIEKTPKRDYTKRDGLNRYLKIFTVHEKFVVGGPEVEKGFFGKWCSVM